MKDNGAMSYTESAEVPKEGSEPIKLTDEHPDFPEWIKQGDGLSCLEWPITESKYLHNRLFWAFDAGRNCVWDQYIKQKSEIIALKQQLKEERNKAIDECRHEIAFMVNRTRKTRK